MSANDKQISGNHYKKNGIQPWDYVIANNMGYLEGSAIKYITRWKDKNGVDDIRKAIHFLEKLIETQVAVKQTAWEFFLSVPEDNLNDTPILRPDNV